MAYYMPPPPAPQNVFCLPQMGAGRAPPPPPPLFYGAMLSGGPPMNQQVFRVPPPTLNRPPPPPPLTQPTARSPPPAVRKAAATSDAAGALDDAETHTYPYSQQCSQLNKSPMCRVAELARHNRLVHVYELVDEAGPAHQKAFTVDLVLREGEVFRGSGGSIKKAQQEAAQLALETSKLTRPDSGRRGVCSYDNQRIPPTVALNTFAAKNRMLASYAPIEVPQFFPLVGSNTFVRPAPSVPRMHSVSLTAGGAFVGHGYSRQAARHHAAQQALGQMAGRRVRAVSKDDSGVELRDDSTAGCSTASEAAPSKSSVSLLHEIALQRRLDLRFDVVAETGPAHNRQYVVRCTLVAPPRTLVAEGEGPSKRDAKQAACSSVLSQWNAQTAAPVAPPSAKPRRARLPKDQKRKTIIKDVKMSPAYGQQVNPISRLIQIQQSKREPEPVFTLVCERGQSRYKEFDVEVRIGDHICLGCGPNKKLAKRAAAEDMLDLLGFSKPLPLPGKSALKVKEPPADDCDDDDDDNGEKDSGDDDDDSTPPAALSPPPPPPPPPPGERTRRVTFSVCDDAAERAAAAGRAPVDELVVPLQSEDNVFVAPKVLKKRPSRQSRRQAANSALLTNGHNRIISNVARQLLDELHLNDNQTESSESVQAEPTSSAPDGGSNLSQLEALVHDAGSRLKITEFPKAATGSEQCEYLSLITIGDSPPEIFSGSGVTAVEARRRATDAALRKLSPASSLALEASVEYNGAAADNESTVQTPTSTSCLAAAACVG